jgi:hypothetical protein
VRYHAIEVEEFGYWGIVDTEYIPWHAKGRKTHFKITQTGLTEEHAKVLAEGLNLKEQEKVASRG